MSSPDEQLRKAQESHKWFAPSMFITLYGKCGVKIEVSAYKHNPDGTIDSDYLNVDGGDYTGAKTRFWELWNKLHHGQYLSILKAVSSYGL